MILFASQRSGASELAAHLLNGDDNDHVTLHDVRGFVAETLEGALREIEAISKGTRCRQFLFSLSLNPPEYADVPIEDFEAAIDEIERKLGLLDQPRVIVFHEKKGRRHCHVVWSRLMFSEHTNRMIAIRMSHFKHKLMEVSRYQFLKHGWKMPEGMRRAQDRSPWHLTREEYRQSVRLSEDAQAIKNIFKSAWEQSDSKETFASALQERGFLLARGDRRGFVALDVTGGIYSLTRWIDIGTRELKARLGKPETLPTVEQAKAYITERMSENLQRYIAESKQRAKDIRQPLAQEIRALVADQRKERETLIDRQEKRWAQETKTRAARIPRGVKGVWHKATGAYKKVRIQNETETKAALERDRKELHALVRSHLLERQELQKTVKVYKEEHKDEELRIRREVARYVSTATTPLLPIKPLASIPIATRMAEIETKIAVLSGNITILQSALENSLISEDARVSIRRMIERTLEKLHIKSVEEKENKEKQHEKEVAEKQAQLNQYIRQYAELQVRQEEEKRKLDANRQFYAVIMNMGYALNGMPRWQIHVASPPPERRLDEQSYTENLRQYSNQELYNRVFTTKQRQPIDPINASVNLRESVLGVKEMLRRAGHNPKDTGAPRPEQTQKAKVKVSVNFNSQRRH